MPNNNQNNEKWIECFKVGVLTDSEGNTRTWTEDDLKKIVSIYNDKAKDNESYQVPLVKGHPDTDAPAYGWVRELRYNEAAKIMEALIAPSSEFVEEIRGEAYKKVSIALYDDLMLRHIGFLGAVAPAVKGLDPVKFSSAMKYAEYDFEEPIANPAAVDYKVQAEARAKKYSISLKDGLGYLEKPSVYNEINEEDFADPVNYVLPFNDKANFLASFNIFRDWNTKEQYKPIERQIVLTRFISKAELLGLDLFEKTQFNYSEYNNPGISLKPEMKRDKPSQYTEYGKNDFADPIHYRFPLKTKTECNASIARFAMDSVKAKYSESENNFIASRIIRSAVNHGIELDPKVWKFNDLMTVNIPIEMLSKTQLIDVYKQNTLNNTGEFSMDKSEWLKAFVTFITQKLNETASEELGTQFQAWTEEYTATNPFPDNAAATDSSAPDSGVTASEPQIPAEFAERLAKVEAENRKLKFTEYAEGLIKANQILPKQKELIVSALESTHDAKLTFSEGNKTSSLSGIEVVKKLVESFPPRAEFSEIANNGNSRTSQGTSSFNAPEGYSVESGDRMELNNRVLKFMEDSAKNGVVLSFTQALSQINKTNK